jgi:hypothetical protein
MADDPQSNPDQQYEDPAKKRGEQSEQGQEYQQDSPKRNPSRQGEDEAQDDQQQGGQRRAS